MKIYCQNCGKVLINGIKICPDCGFENKITKKRRWSNVIIIFLIALFILGGITFFFRNKARLFYSKIVSEYVYKETDTNVLGSSKEEEVLKNFYDYQRMTEVDLCQEAYDKYITAGSKERKGYSSFLSACKYRGSDWKNFNIIDVYFSSDTKVDVKFSVDILTPDTYSTEYGECIERILRLKISSGIKLCNDTSPKVLKYKEWVETWFYEDGMWKRDY